MIKRKNFWSFRDLKNAELLVKGQKLIYSRFVDGILDHDKIHRFGREETFSDSYNGWNNGHLIIICPILKVKKIRKRCCKNCI